MALDTTFHEVWWIYSASAETWGGLRIAHFRKMGDEIILVILGEPLDRLGPRVWSDIKDREGWHKVEQIPIPKI